MYNIHVLMFFHLTSERCPLCVVPFFCGVVRWPWALITQVCHSHRHRWLVAMTADVCLGTVPTTGPWPVTMSAVTCHIRLSLPSVICNRDSDSDWKASLLICVECHLGLYGSDNLSSAHCQPQTAEQQVKYCTWAFNVNSGLICRYQEIGKVAIL